MNAQGFNEGQAYSAQDVRYVSKDGKVYATIMAWPKDGDFTFKAFSTAEATYSGDVEKVELLGYEGEISFKQNLKGLTIKVPNTKPNNIAPVFRITVKGESSIIQHFLQLIINHYHFSIKKLSG
jgi:alpha-L-fucosidase